VVVISKAILVQCCHSHPDAVAPLNEWWRKTKKADWSSLGDIKKTFNSVDYVGNDRYVFNIKGNKYRLVAMIFFDIRTVYVRFIDTHAKYDKIDCTTI
jgi:mRNA interferase HigB